MLAKNFVISIDILLAKHISAKKTSGQDDCSLSTYSKLSDLEIFRNLRNKDPKNPIIGYLNIYRLRYKIIDLMIIVKDLPLNYFVVTEIKLDESFPSLQFIISFKDRDRHGSGVNKICQKRFHLQNAKPFRT